MNFIFLQPELRSKTSSHFYQYIHAVSNALKKMGHQTAVVGNEILDEAKNGHPSFKNRVSKKADALSVLLRIAKVNITASGELRNIFSHFASRDDRSVFFVDTVLNNRVIALAGAFRKISGNYPFVRMIVVFRFTYRSNSKILTALQRSLHRLFVLILKKQINSKHCLLVTDSALLKDMYERTITAPVAVVPIPLQTPLYASFPAQRKANPHPRPVIGFVGGTAAYKGLSVYLDLIASPGIGDADYIVHGIKGTDALFAFAAPYVSQDVYKTLEEKRERICTYAHLDETEYLSLFLKMDIIIIPYSSPQFAEGTSNVFTEAVAAGLIPLVPRNTWMAAELEKLSMQRLVIDLGDIKQMRATLTSTLSQREELAEKMEVISVQWRAFHDSLAFADNLIEMLQ